MFFKNLPFYGHFVIVVFIIWPQTLRAGVHIIVWTAVENPFRQRVPSGPAVSANKTEKLWTPEFSGNFVLWTMEQKI